MGGACILLCRPIYKQHMYVFFLYQQILETPHEAISAGWEREGNVAEVKTMTFEPLCHVTFTQKISGSGWAGLHMYPFIWWQSANMDTQCYSLVDHTISSPWQANQVGNLVDHCHWLSRLLHHSASLISLSNRPRSISENSCQFQNTISKNQELFFFFILSKEE